MQSFSSFLLLGTTPHVRRKEGELLHARDARFEDDNEASALPTSTWKEGKKLPGAWTTRFVDARRTAVRALDSRKEKHL